MPRREWLPLPWEDEARPWPRGGHIGNPSDPFTPHTEYASPDPNTGDVWPDVCPGYLAHTEIADGASRLWPAFDKGVLDVMAPALGNAEADGLVELAGSSSRYESEWHEISRARMERDREKNRG